MFWHILIVAVPTISSIAPGKGPTMGDFVIGITGTGFRVPPLPAFGQSTGINSVRVEVDGAPSVQVQVFDATFLTVLMPKHGVGNVPIRIDNLDVNGAPISGETVTFFFYYY